MRRSAAQISRAMSQRACARAVRGSSSSITAPTAPASNNRARLARARSQINDELGFATVFGPAEWRRVVSVVFDVDARAAAHEQLHGFQVTAIGGVVQRCGMGVEALRVEAVRILARVEQEP